MILPVGSLYEPSLLPYGLFFSFVFPPSSTGHVRSQNPGLSWDENSSVLKVTLPESTVNSVGFMTVKEHSQNYHIILRVTDEGVPALSRYKRVIVTVVE